MKIKIIGVGFILLVGTLDLLHHRHTRNVFEKTYKVCCKVITFIV